MSKKVLRLFSILFLSSILVLSCSNTDKTGSNTSSKGLGYYAGTWYPYIQQVPTGTILIISSDGSVSIEETNTNTNTNTTDKSTDVTDKGNETYDVKFVDQGPNPGTYILTLKFNGDTSGTFSISDGQDTFNGTIRKQ